MTGKKSKAKHNTFLYIFIFHIFMFTTCNNIETYDPIKPIWSSPNQNTACLLPSSSFYIQLTDLICFAHVQFQFKI